MTTTTDSYSTPCPALYERIEASVRRAVVGHSTTLHNLIVALFAGGHVLLEGVPGLAKTLLARTLAGSIDATFRRIQFTPDLLPSDILGSLVFQRETETFVPSPGPIFANIVLADEINRAPPKVQSALLEAMEERQVSLGKESFPLQEPFLVLATQNPLEHHGTYPLAEAQIDRFMMQLHLGYPAREEEKDILRLAGEPKADTGIPAITGRDLLEAREEIRQVHLHERIHDYVVDIVRATRGPASVTLSHLGSLVGSGASPRAGIHLQAAARTEAFLRGRSHVLPEDVKAMAPDVLRHRLILTVEAHARGVGPDAILREILALVPVP